MVQAAGDDGTTAHRVAVATGLKSTNTPRMLKALAGRGLVSNWGSPDHLVWGERQLIGEGRYPAHPAVPRPQPQAGPWLSAVAATFATVSNLEDRFSPGSSKAGRRPCSRGLATAARNERRAELSLSTMRSVPLASDSDQPSPGSSPRRRARGRHRLAGHRPWHRRPRARRTALAGTGAPAASEVEARRHHQDVVAQLS